MSTTTPNMGLTKPDPDGSSGTWDTELNASLDRADIHDHSSGLGVLVPVAGLNINADLPFAGFAISGLKALDLSAITPLTSGYLTSLFVSSADNELYWRTNGGVNVKLTSGTTLNAALLGGFIGADYGVAGAQAEFDGTTNIYNFLQAVTHRANLDVGNVRLFEPSSGITAAVKLKSPVALAGSYDWIFPDALPASTKLLSLSSTGQLATTAAVTMDGNLAVVGTLSASGLITATAGLTAAANQHVTISGTGVFKHGDVTEFIPASEGFGNAAALDAADLTINPTGAGIWSIPIRKPVGARIRSLLLDADDTAGSATIRLYRSFGGVLTAVTAESPTSGVWGSNAAILSAIDHTILTSAFYQVRVTFSGGAEKFTGVRLIWDQP